jgi:hypothetical protein
LCSSVVRIATLYGSVERVVRAPAPRWFIALTVVLYRVRSRPYIFGFEDFELCADVIVVV